MYQVKKTLADTGRVLSNLLLEYGLVSEISLLVHPIIIGKRSYNIFGNLSKTVNTQLENVETFGEGYVWLVYRILK